MSKREKRYTACASIMTILLVGLIMMACSGCAGGKGLRIEVDTEGPAADQSKSVKLETDYQIENGFELRRNTKTGDYEIILGSATTKDADSGVWMMMSQMLQMLQGYMIPAASPPPIPPAPDSVP